MDRADNFWAANQADEQVAAVTTTTPPTTQNPSTQNTAEADIAAVNRGRGQGFRGASGYGGRGRCRGVSQKTSIPKMILGGRGISQTHHGIVARLTGYTLTKPGNVKHH